MCMYIEYRRCPWLVVAFHLIYFIHNAFNILLIWKKHLNKRRARGRERERVESQPGEKEEHEWVQATSERVEKLGHWLLFGINAMHHDCISFFFFPFIFFIFWYLVFCFVLVVFFSGGFFLVRFYLWRYWCVRPMRLLVRRLFFPSLLWPRLMLF